MPPTFAPNPILSRFAASQPPVLNNAMCLFAAHGVKHLMSLQTSGAHATKASQHRRVRLPGSCIALKAAAELLTPSAPAGALPCRSCYATVARPGAGQSSAETSNKRNSNADGVWRSRRVLIVGERHSLHPSCVHPVTWKCNGGMLVDASGSTLQ